MYLNDFSKMALRKNVIFGAFNRALMVLQGNLFLKYLKIPQNMTLCMKPSQGLKPVDLCLSWKGLSIKLFGNFFSSVNKGEKWIATPLVAQGSSARVVRFPS